MWLRSAYLICLFVGVLTLAGQVAMSARADGEYVAVVTIDGRIDPVSERYLSRSLRSAAEDGGQLVVIRLDTPGGLLTSTRKMVESILSAEVPVAVYVAPAGARAASAGTFITAAANFAVMAPGTNIGAASPISSGGQDLPSTLAKKINEDTRAFIRSIAEARGRNGRALEETVTLARSYSADEAVELNVVDFIAKDLSDLLSQLDGQAVDTVAGPRVLRVMDAEIREFKLSLLDKFLNVVTNPDLVFVFLIIGGLGILAEFMTPGFIGPGVVGAIALALAFLGAGQLPVNWIGVGLILFAMVLFFLEAQEAGIGVFAIGGITCLILGAFLLFGGYFSTPEVAEPGSRVSVWLIGVIPGFMALCLLFFLYIIRPTGSSSGDYSGSQLAIVGKQGVAISDLGPSGKVEVENQQWTAITDPGDLIREREEVTVLAVYGGDVLKVSKALPQARSRRWFGFGKLLRKR